MKEALFIIAGMAMIAIIIGIAVGSNDNPELQKLGWSIIIPASVVLFVVGAIFLVIAIREENEKQKNQKEKKGE